MASPLARSLTTGLFALLLGLGASPSNAQMIATLTLDGFSVLSFDDKQLYMIPAGSVIPLHFAERRGTLASFRIEPAEVEIAPVSLGGEKELRFRLVRPAQGTAAQDPSGRWLISFTADIAVSLVHPTLGGSKRLRLTLTTEAVQASSSDRKTKLAVSGMRADPAARAVQLVTATTNGSDDFPAPGAAVYAVVSGVLDRLP